MAHEAKLSAERIIRKLDHSTTYVQRTLARANRPAQSLNSFPHN
jgi:hypothetical protein